MAHAYRNNIARQLQMLLQSTSSPRLSLETDRRSYLDTLSRKKLLILHSEKATGIAGT